MNNTDKIVDKLIAKIESGKLNWNRPWTMQGGFLPQNFISKIPYNGINMLTCMANEFASPYYLTANQIKKLKGSWKGEGTPIVFWQIFTKETIVKGTLMERSIPMLKLYYVWNAEQITGIDFTKEFELKELEPIEAAQTVIDNWADKPNIKISHSARAYYSLTFDYIQMPLLNQFIGANEYYSTLFHEAVHSTGHEFRLKRLGIAQMNSEGVNSYSFEELVAEFGAAFLCAATGIANENTEKNSAAYLQGWVSKLKDDKQMLFKAAAAAQKAVNLITGKVYEVKEKVEVEAVA